MYLFFNNIGIKQINYDYKKTKALIITQHNINNARITIIHICHLFNNIMIYKIYFVNRRKITA